MPGPPRYRDQKALRGALDSGSIEEVDVDQRVLAILHLLRRVGKFTDRRETPAEQAINRPDHAELIRKAGADGIVLLKNSGQTLPLRQKPKKMAILGPLARVAAAHGGGSASLNCHYKVTPYDALTERLPGCDISYSKGCHIFRSLPDLREGCVDRDGRPGFKVELYASADLSGEVMWTEESPKGFFTTLMNTNATGALSARLTTVFSPTESGKHYLSFSGVGPSKLFIDGELVLHQEKEIPDSMAYFLGVQDEQRLQYSFEAGRSYEIRVESIPSQVDNSELFLMQGNISAHLGFVMQGEMEADLLAEAVALAKDADVAVFFVGNTAQWETEGQDMASMALPADGSQDRLIAEVAKVNPNTVVVISTGVAVELPWLSDVSAVLQSWYAGQEVGNAIADVLLGVVNPGGKLPVSWPRKYEHTGCYGNFGLDSYDSRKVEYVEGVNVGYRHFDRHYGTDMEVLFPFGYGLSYTQFAVSNIRVSGSINQVNSEVTITATVSNVGGCHGSETIQVYLAPPEDSTADRPPQSLVAFDKVFLEAGQATEVSLVFKEDGAAYWDAEGNEWRVEKGLHQVKVSTSSHSRDVKAQVPLEVKGFSYAA